MQDSLVLLRVAAGWLLSFYLESSREEDFYFFFSREKEGTGGRESL